MIEVIYFIGAIPLVIFSFYFSTEKLLPYYCNSFFIFFTFLQGIIIKPIFMALEIPSVEINDGIIYPVLIHDYWYGALISLPFYYLFLISTAPILSKNKNIQENIPTGNDNYVFSIIALVIIALISIIGFFGFISQFPSVADSFNKQKLAQESLEEYRGGGIWRLLVSFSLIISIFAIWNVGVGYKKLKSILIFLSSALIYFLFNIISDQRGNILGACFLWLISFHLFIRKLTKKNVAAVIFVFICIGLTQTIYRVSTSTELNSESVNLTIANIIGRNGIEHSKTIHILDSVPDKMDFLYGQSFVDAVAILLPRDLFPNKATVNLETIVAQKIFDVQYFGAGAIPPGLLAELFMNFSWLGVAVGAIFFGRLTGYLDEWFSESTPGSLFFFFYLTSLFTFGASILGSGFSSTFTGLALNFISLLFCYACAKKLNSHSLGA